MFLTENSLDLLSPPLPLVHPSALAMTPVESQLAFCVWEPKCPGFGTRIECPTAFVPIVSGNLAGTACFTGKACEYLSERLQCFCSARQVNKYPGSITNVNWIRFCFTCLQQRSTSPWTVVPQVRFKYEYVFINSRIYFKSSISSSSTEWFPSLSVWLFPGNCVTRIQNFFEWQTSREKYISESAEKPNRWIPPI